MRAFSIYCLHEERPRYYTVVSVSDDTCNVDPASF